MRVTMLRDPTVKDGVEFADYESIWHPAYQPFYRGINDLQQVTIRNVAHSLASRVGRSGA
jgi:hypothetical protein